jgi:glycosyltransferase involved in cell wall biosynthesis
LKDYFNPCGFFGEVYSLAPYEGPEGLRAGVVVMPTPRQQLPARLSELGIDVVRAYGAAHPCAIACAAKTSGIPVVVSVHDARPALVDPSIANADVVLCVSQTVKRLVATRFTREDRVWELPNRVDVSEMRPHTHDEVTDLAARYPFRYKIVHVGRKAPEKNLETIIRTLPLLGPEYCVIAAGSGSTVEYARVAAEAGVADRCFLLDAVANNELSRYYSFADCCCMPSRTEAFHLVVAEALACGAVVVASGISAHRELIEHGRNGLLVDDYENPVALADALRTACADDRVRHSIKGEARGSVERFERRRIDALEASYYSKVFDLRAAGAFRAPVSTRLQRRLTQVVRGIPQPIKNTIKPLLGR